MYYGSIKPCDIANGTGVRVTLFVSGCTHRCKGCFQPQTWDFRYGQPFTAETEEALLEALDRPYISGLTLLGGEPFEPDNQRALLPFLRRLRQQLPDKTVWAFSGYTWEELTGQSRARCEATGALLSLVDVLVDGEFVEALRDISLRFRGSSNQRLLDVPASLAAGQHGADLADGQALPPHVVRPGPAESQDEVCHVVVQGAEKSVFAVKAQLQPEVGVFLLDMPPQAGKGIADPVPGQAEADQARDVARRRPGIVHPLTIYLQHLLTRPCELLPRRCQCHCPCAALHQPEVQLALQRRDAFAEGWLGDV